jgi:hypothetical protein
MDKLRLASICINKAACKCKDLRQGDCQTVRIVATPKVCETLQKLPSETQRKTNESINALSIDYLLSAQYCDPKLQCFHLYKLKTY